MSATASANPYQSPESNVAPSGFAPSTELAGRGSRLAAAILDGLFTMAFLLPGILVSLLAMESPGAVTSANATGMEMFSGIGGLLMLVGFVAWVIITIRLVAANGWTLGKRVCSIRVVRCDGSDASLGRIFFLRNVIINLLGAIPILGAFIGIADILFIFGEARRTLHDRIADTIVVQA